jgi:hypothetical protein
LASRLRRPGLFTVPIHCSYYNVCQVLMLTALGLAGFGAYRRRAPTRHDGLVDFGGYRRQVAAQWRHFDLCPAATSGETVSMVLCGKPTIWIRGKSTQKSLHTTNQPGPFGSLDVMLANKQKAQISFCIARCDPGPLAPACREPKKGCMLPIVPLVALSLVYVLLEMECLNQERL